jgi:hypothetical protein
MASLRAVWVMETSKAEPILRTARNATTSENNANIMMETITARILVPTVVVRVFTRYSWGRCKPSATGLNSLSARKNRV